MVAMIPSPGMGHLIPMIELAKRVVGYEKLRVSFVIPSSGPPTKAQIMVLEALPPSITHVFLPPVTLSDLPADSKIETRISHTVLRSLTSLRDTFHSLSATHTLAAVVVDLFATDAFDVAREFNASPYVFYPSTATVLSLFLHLRTLHRDLHCDFKDLPHPVNIPGCIPFHGKDILDPLQDRKDDAYAWVLHHANRYPEAQGILVNTFPELEPGPIKHLLTQEPPVYAVGPLVRMESISSSGSAECLAWLDQQPRGSVLFVSFGSAGTLSSAQINELALGLESSQQRFLWVVKSPNDKLPNASYFTADTHADPFHFLPQGFVQRTKARALLLPSWAPQPQVLAHPSTAAFLTHCGWNSVLESIVNGVPLLSWPLFAEQKMNAFMLTHDVNVSLIPTSSSDDGLVHRHEIATLVKSLMEGEEGKKLRYRIKDLKDAAAKALADDGSSTNHISTLALRWSNAPVTNLT
ncbi:hypothetical protein Fmac_007176 [Flemingia macrophylla]|uniref:Glycosyltransferase n=1 Tax=Flemingia macrophylla TaxID=520843 RepID=A0ABD1NCS5_9FABA